MAKEKLRCSNCGRVVLYEAKSVKNHQVSCGVCGKSTPVEARAVAKYVLTAPRKLRLVADAIRGKQVKDALTLLRFTPKRAARVLYKVVASARANAENTYQMDLENLVVSNVQIDGGPTLKRFMPRAMGRAAMVRKRTSHVTVRLREATGPVAVEEKPKARRRTGRKPAPEKKAPEKSQAAPRAQKQRKSPSKARQE